MRKKIQDIIRGKIETPAPSIILPDKDLQIAVIEHDISQGSFSFYSNTAYPVRGLVTCPDPNLICMTPKFDGKRIQVLFEYHGKDMEEGDEKDGYFVITSNAGEYLYPYHVRTTRNYAHTSIGWIKSLADFTNLAKLNWAEALTLFQSARFTQIFRKDQEREKELYLALSARGINSARMEEFLIGAGCKERCRFTVEETKQTFVIGKEPIRESIRIEKSQWGYLPLQITCDAPFVRISEMKPENIGLSAKFTEAGYTILPNLMHGGRNFAKIRIEDISHTAEMEIVVVSEHFRGYQDKETLRDVFSALQTEFLHFKMGRLSLLEWKDSALRRISSARRTYPEDNWLPLFQAYVYLSTGDQARGGHIMEDFSEKTNLKRTPEEALYQYLTTFRNTDPAYRKEVIYYLRDLFKKHHTKPMLAWILLSLDDALLRSDERRYQFIRQFMTEHSCNPILYFEASMLVQEHPEYLHTGGRFEQRLVRWMQKKKLAVSDIPDHFFAQLSDGSVYHAHTFRIMTDYYAEHPSDQMLKSICSYLIKTSHFAPEDSYWLRQGIEKDIKVAGLFEAFLRVWDRKEEMPAKVRKYFMLQRDLPWKWKAKLYAHVLTECDRIGDDWKTYERMIMEFGRDALAKRYMNQDLMQIYRYLQAHVTGQEWEKISSDNDRTSCFTVLNDRIMHICVADPGQRDMINIPLHDRMAFIRLPQKPPVILLQDHVGNLYVTNGLCEMMPLFASVSRQQAAQPDPDADAATVTSLGETDIALRLEAFDDSLARMDELIVLGKKTGLVSTKHEEQLLARMLFTGTFTASHESCFEDVVKSHDNPMLCDAYACWFAKQYLMDRVQIPQQAVYYILYAMQNERALNDECLAALLKYQYTTLLERPLLPRTAERMLRNILLKGWVFGFFSQLPEPIKRRYLLQGLLFIQYSGEPGQLLELETTLEDPEDPDCVVTDTRRYTEILSGVYCIGIPVLPSYRFSYRIMQNRTVCLEERQMIVDPGFISSGSASMILETAKIFADNAVSEEQTMRTARLTDLTEDIFGILEE